MTPSLTRRSFVGGSTAVALAAGLGGRAVGAAPAVCPAPHPLLTQAGDFYDVSRGNPKPQTLQGEALVKAKLTPETWRCEVVADPFTGEFVKQPASLAKQLTIADGTALDLPMLMKLGEKHRVRFIKAMQCLNIAEPLGQGLWEGVPLREVLRLCGRMTNVRRIYFWGFHNDDPKQLFQSSLSYTEAMETPPGGLPAFLAWRLNGEQLSLLRGGPVRMVIPWAHGFKSIKWLRHIAVTNDYRANDTYAEQNNDPESHLKTAAYIDTSAAKFPAGGPVFMTGRVISGLSGLRRVEYWLRPAAAGAPALRDDDPAWASARWQPCELESAPGDWRGILPAGVSSKDVLGFDPATGRPLSWPLPYSMVSWSVALRDLKPGHYEFRARAVDLNGFAQPEPRPMAKAGKNGLEVQQFEVG
ncbi:MAG: molybdopterin-dependent oxidoreductase [Verrucomicrobiaceae bacterium]